MSSTPPGCATSGPVEAQGIARAWRAIDEADRVLLVIDDRTGVDTAVENIARRLPPQLAVTRIYNKIDISGRRPGPHPPPTRVWPSPPSPAPV